MATLIEEASTVKQSIDLAILMTCHNRRKTTLDCLHSIYCQNIDLDVYLVDDGSTDGISDAVRKAYPKVHLLKGDGNLFWVGGMRLAFDHARKQEHKYYLWLNDDTLLERDALSKLLNFHQSLIERGYSDSIVVASTHDPVTKEPTYGGAVQSKAWYSNKYEFLRPQDVLCQCETMFGNCVLIPDSVANKVGNLDGGFVHNFGDLDYGLRARKAGCTIWIAPGYLASCSKNSVRGSWADTNLPLMKRLEKVIQIKAFPPAPWALFNKRHFGLLWFFYWLLPYIRAVIGYRDLSTSPTFCQDAEQPEKI